MFSLKVIVSIGLVLLLFQQVDIARMLGVISVDLIPALLLAALVLLIQSFGIGYRWHALLSTLGLMKDLGWALKRSFIATFFNQCLPSSIGGDGYRMIAARRAGLDWQPAVSCVLVERYTALVCLIIVAALGLIPLLMALTETSLIWLFIGFVIAGFAGAFLVASLAEIAAFQKLPGIISRLLNAWIVGRIFADMRRVIRSRRLLLILGGAGLVNNAANGVALWIIGNALGIELGLGPYMTIIAMATLITVIPISFAGWGLRDGVIVLLLGAVGVAQAEALIISISFGMALLISSIPGGVMLWRSVDIERIDETTAKADIVTDLENETGAAVTSEAPVAAEKRAPDT
ncbi:MAG: lysylphosphatidylglycerol synthase transmembrane domain-containing protein [Pseudomonadota bacterium]